MTSFSKNHHEKFVKTSKKLLNSCSCQETKRIGYWRNSQKDDSSQELKIPRTSLNGEMQIWDKLCFLIWRTTQKMTMKKPCTTGHGRTQNNRRFCTNSYLIQCLLSVLWSGWSRCFCPQPQGNRLNINMSEIVTVGLDFEFREYLNKLKIVAYLYAEI